MDKEVQLKEQAHEGPILRLELLAERQAASNVQHVLGPKDVEGLERGLGLLLGLDLRVLLLNLLLRLLPCRLGRLGLLRSGLRLLRSGLRLLLIGLAILLLLLLQLRFRSSDGGGLDSLPLSHRLPGRSLGHLLGRSGFVVLLLLLPNCNNLLPTLELLAGPIRWLQFLYSRVDLLVQDPLLQVLLGLRSCCPLVPDFVEALLLLRQGEFREVGAEDDCRKVLHERRPEAQLLFLGRQSFLWHRLFRLLRLLLGLVLFLILLLLLLFRRALFLGPLFLHLFVLLLGRFPLILTFGFLLRVLGLLLCRLLCLFLGLLGLLLGQLEHLLPRLLSLLLLLSDLLLPRLLHFSCLPSLLGLRLLVPQDHVLNSSLVLCGRLPDYDVGDLFEHGILPT
mmetsp:Transcript_18383/g.53111  ORF Transcript_18383/g.53111 Transcript_18383/m.53111 type:complete len:393 (-) Transcript_18383:809-1987(-)